VSSVLWSRERTVPDWGLGALLVCFASLIDNCPSLFLEGSTRWGRIQSLYSCEWFQNDYHQVNYSKFCPSFYSQDLISFDSLSRDWILKLDPNDNFRNWY
jgi:hypothetical protein